MQRQCEPPVGPNPRPLPRGGRGDFWGHAASLACLLCLLAGCSSPTPIVRAPAAILPAPVSASAVAVDAGGGVLAAVNPDSGSVTLLDLPGLSLRAEVPVGADPRTLSFTPDGARLLVANYGAGTISVIDVAAGRVEAEVAVGARPYGVVAGSDRAYISLAGQPQIVVLDLATLTVAARIPVEPFPTGLALTRDQASLYVTHLYSGTVTVIDTASLRESLASGSADPDANLSQFIVLSPDGAHAYLPGSLSRSDNPSLTYSTTVQPVLAMLARGTSGGLAAGGEIDLAQSGEAVNLPFAAALSPDGGTLFVANAGSDDVSVIDLAAGRVRALLPAGRNPRGLALSPDGAPGGAPAGGRLFVDNVLDGTLSVFDTHTLALLETVTLTHIPLPADVLAGKRLFNSALPPMSSGQWLSCASCHFDGGADGHTWAGFPDGPRNTPALYGAAATLPLHWNGDLSELQDTEGTIRTIQGGAGLMPGPPPDPHGPSVAGRSADLDALAAYLGTLAPAPSPYAPAGDDQRAAVARGAEAYQRWGCAACHAAPLYTDRLAHISDIGDPALERHQAGPLPRFDTPSLLGVWATAPYFHDGSAATLRDTLFSADFHKMGPAMDDGEVDDLLAYLRALP